MASAADPSALRWYSALSAPQASASFKACRSTVHKCAACGQYELPGGSTCVANRHATRSAAADAASDGCSVMCRHDCGTAAGSTPKKGICGDAVER